MEGRIGLLHRNGSMDGFDRDLVLARLVGKHTQEMDRIGLIRFGRDNLAVDLLGSLQPAALMVLESDRQRLRDRCHSDYSLQL